MPYIHPDSRLKNLEPVLAGELTYKLTEIVHQYLNYHRSLRDLQYSDFNTVIGALEVVKLELYRQLVAPYEDVKKKENGPISELDS